MDLSIYIERTRKSSLIEERFIISPKKKILTEEDRGVFHFINLLCLHHSLPLPILEIKRFDFLRMHIYSWDEKVLNTEISKTIKYKYIPYVGERSCAKCIHFRKIGRRSFCSGRLKEIKDNVWKGCMYWTENSIIKEIQSD